MKLTVILQSSLYLLFLTSVTVSPDALAWDTIRDGMDLRCNQPESSRLKCYYRPLLGGTVNNVSAHADEIELPVNMDLGGQSDSASIFFLIDTSDPGRQDVITKNIQQIENLLSASTGDYNFGLATFDNKLRILAPIGSNDAQIVAALKEIKAKGRTTELYRSLLLTIEKLSRTASNKKLIYLFSDGQAEDKAYFHGDVVKAARNKGVVINSVGFPRSVSLSVALQTLRRLSEETGGVFTESDYNFKLPSKFYQAAFANVDTGSGFNVDLGPLVNANIAGQTTITLEFNSDIGDTRVKAPVFVAMNKMARPTAPALEPQAPVPAVPAQPEIRIIAPAGEPDKLNFWLWYGLPIAIVLLFLISLVTLILTYRKQPSGSSSGADLQQQTKPFAYLVTQEEKPKRHPVLNTTWRIGRSRDNELVLDDNSVSRLHAEIHRYNNGNFFILDMKSLNGIYVNDEQVSKKKLEEGDIIEIGDIFLRFTQFSEDYGLDDDTAMQVTKTPVH